MGIGKAKKPFKNVDFGVLGFSFEEENRGVRGSLAKKSGSSGGGE